MERDLPAEPRRARAANSLGIITSGISFMHVREAAPDASLLKLGFTHPLADEEDRRSLSRAWTAAW